MEVIQHQILKMKENIKEEVDILMLALYPTGRWSIPAHLKEGQYGFRFKICVIRYHFMLPKPIVKGTPIPRT